ncbi:MAG TPA: peptidylprolyl isomerase [Bryobacteraceae bacterium]|nr:peptidylprolyl isomerase [Bryobacteraceae bacterium]
MRVFPIFAIITAAAFAQTSTAPAPAVKPARPAAAKPAAPALPPGLYAIIHTSMGNITAELFEKEAPVAVQNFVGLARGTKEWTDPRTGQKVKKPLYSGTTFHRVIPGFMIQGGDPLGNGMGTPGYNFKDEFAPNLKFDRPGRLAMANSGPNTNGSQFFITETAQDRLDGGYTIFGQVVEGQDLVPKIANVPRNAEDKPLTPVRILYISIRRVPAAPAKRATPTHTNRAPSRTPAPVTK